MTGYLLDFNVLLALSWRWHQFHERVHSWFAKNASKGWATCPMVEASFVRIVSNPAFSRNAISTQEAIDALKIDLQHPAHQFWPDDIPFADAVMGLEDRLVGHQQITDAYLLGLAVHHEGKLATLDKKLAGLLRDSPVRRHVELID